MKGLTKPMQKALDCIRCKGYVYAGVNVRNGGRVRALSRTLLALEARGLVTLSVGSHGAMKAAGVQPPGSAS